MQTQQTRVWKLLIGILDNCAVQAMQLNLLQPGTGLSGDQVLLHINSSYISFADPSQHVLSCFSGPSTTGYCWRSYC